MNKLDKVKFFIGLGLSIYLLIGLLMLITGAKIASGTTESPQKGDFAFPEEEPLIGQNNVELEVWLDKLVTYENCPWNGVVDSNGVKKYVPSFY